eukprot:6187007-Pleurochrysis_carterae.AAC.1
MQSRYDFVRRRRDLVRLKGDLARRRCNLGGRRCDLGGRRCDLVRRAPDRSPCWKMTSPGASSTVNVLHAAVGAHLRRALQTTKQENRQKETGESDWGSQRAKGKEVRGVDGQ